MAPFTKENGLRDNRAPVLHLLVVWQGSNKKAGISWKALCYGLVGVDYGGVRKLTDVCLLRAFCIAPMHGRSWQTSTDCLQLQCCVLLQQSAAHAQCLPFAVKQMFCTSVVLPGIGPLAYCVILSRELVCRTMIDVLSLKPVCGDEHFTSGPCRS
jgi:hypothetical protein